MKQRQGRAVFLDRDGVLNRATIQDGKPYPPASLDELQLMPGVVEALTTLKAEGFLLVGVTNQPDVTRGQQTRETVEAINAALMRELPLADILVCYHDDQDGCGCRKPQPGLLLQAAQTYQLILEACFMIGDRWRDVEAGQRAGCQTLLLDYGYQERRATRAPDCVVYSLSEAAQWILNHIM